MGYGQMMMAFLAAVLLSTLILNINKNSLVLDRSINEYKYRELSFNLAQSIIDEAQTKKFDKSTAGFTSVGNLGLDAGESFTAVPPKADDFDDYNNYKHSTNATGTKIQIQKVNGKTIPQAIFKDSCKVVYVNYPGFQPVNYTTNFKRLEVCVWCDANKNPFTGKTDTVKLYTICGDWDNP